MRAIACAVLFLAFTAASAAEAFAPVERQRPKESAAVLLSAQIGFLLAALACIVLGV